MINFISQDLIKAIFRVYIEDQKNLKQICNGLKAVVDKIHAIDDMKTTLDDLKATPDATHVKLKRLKVEITKKEVALLKEIKASQPPRKKLKRELNSLTMESPVDYFSKLTDTFYQSSKLLDSCSTMIRMLRKLTIAPWNSSESTMLLHDVEPSFFSFEIGPAHPTAHTLRLNVQSNPIPPDSNGLDLNIVAETAVLTMDTILMGIPPGIRARMIQVYEDLLSSIISTLAAGRITVQWSPSWSNEARTITGIGWAASSALNDLIYQDLYEHHASAIRTTEATIDRLRCGRFSLPDPESRAG